MKVDETGAQRVALGTAPNGGTVTPLDASNPLPVSLLSSIFWTESSANQAAGATLNGASRANGGVAGGAGSPYEWFVAEAFTDQSGTLYIDKSVDGGTTWRQVGTIAAVIGTSVSLRVPVSAALYRARFINGAAVTTTFLLTTAYAT